MVTLALISALSLGIYDIFRKVSLKDNAVIPVLTVSILISALFFLPILLYSHLYPEAQTSFIYVPPIDGRTHFLILIKALILLGSWISAFFGMKHIPITLFSPIRATQPMWVVLGAFLIFGERLTPLQLIGVALILLSFYCFSVTGTKEGISWRSNRWVWLVILATLLGSASGLYDKYLLQQYNRMAVQVYNTFYQAVIMLIILWMVWYPQRKKGTPFRWKWSIVGISLFLTLSDFVYFWALSLHDSKISLISPIRRSGAIVPFIFGALFLYEKNLKMKAILLCGVLAGVVLLCY
jgi:drug/metabolite transporter (DMT)-like permease